MTPVVSRIGAPVALVLAIAGCNLGELKKANEKVEQSNALFEEAKELAEEADEIKSDAVDESEESKRKSGGKKCKKKYAAAEEKLDEAKDLIKEASKLNVAKEFSQYLSTKAKQYGKVAEALAAHGEMCAELSKEPDNERLSELVEEAKTALEEAEELSDEADDIRDEHPEKFAD